MFGAPLGVYLGKMLEAPNMIISLAATSEGIIVGFVSARREVTKGAWQIRPLYADNTLIARCMLHVFSILASKAVPDEYAIMCVPCDVNPEAHELHVGKELKGSLHACSVQMYSRGTPNIPKQKNVWSDAN